MAINATRKKQTTVQERALGWAIKKARKDAWRVAPAMDMDDLIQDAHVVLLRCVQRYGNELDGAHFMALFKTAYCNHLSDCARSRIPTVCLPRQTAWYPDNAHLLTLLTEGPRELAVVVAALQSGADRTPPTGRVRRLKIRQTTNCWLGALCEYMRETNGQDDLAKVIRGYLTTGV